MKRKVWKGISFFCSVISMPVLTTISSCGSSEIENKKVDITVVGDSNVLSWKIKGNTYTKFSFGIEFELEAGHRDINKNTFKIYNGEKELKINEDYKFVDFNKIEFIRDRVINTKILVKIETLASFNKWTFKWADDLDCGKVLEDGCLCIEPDKTLKKEDFDISAYKSSGEMTKWEFGTQKDKNAQLLYVNPQEKDITQDFINNGFKVTNDMLKPDEKGIKHSTKINLWLRFSYHNFCQLSSTRIVAGKPITNIDLKEPEKQIAAGDKVNLYNLVSVAPEGGFENCKFDILDKGSTNCFFDNEGYLVVPTAGEIKIKITSLYNQSLQKEKTLTVI